MGKRAEIPCWWSSNHLRSKELLLPDTLLAYALRSVVAKITKTTVIMLLISLFYRGVA